MMADTFNVGDVVQLKSGGPLMTVNGTGDDSMTGEFKVYCTWFDQKGKQTQSTFVPDVLNREDSGD